MLYRRSRSYRRALLTVLLLTTWMGAATGRAAQPAAAQVAASPHVTTTSLGVASINLWHKDRPDELRVVAERLRRDVRQAPDFVLCQEVVFNRGGAQDNTAAVLGSYLGYHVRGTKRTSDREGIAIVSRYPFIHYDELHLRSQTSPMLAGFRRVSVMGEFLVEGVGRVRVVNVHFTNWGFEHRVRGNQIEETLAWIAQRQRMVPAAMTFLGGDFNAKRDWNEMDQVGQHAAAGVRFLDFNTDRPTMGSPGAPHKRIDYIFVSAPFYKVQLNAEQILWPDGLLNGSEHFYLSDHVFLMHTYSFARGGTYARSGSFADRVP